MSCLKCNLKVYCNRAFRVEALSCERYDYTDCPNPHEILDVRTYENRRVYEALWNSVMTACIGRNKNIENNIFAIRQYDWNDNDDNVVDNNAWHFWHKPSGFKIAWYKYPLRGYSWNMILTPDQFLDVLYDCVDSIYSNVKHQYTKWWHVDPVLLCRGDE